MTPFTKHLRALSSSLRPFQNNMKCANANYLERARIFSLKSGTLKGAMDRRLFCLQNARTAIFNETLDNINDIFRKKLLTVEGIRYFMLKSSFYEANYCSYGFFISY